MVRMQSGNTHYNSKYKPLASLTFVFVRQKFDSVIESKSVPCLNIKPQYLLCIIVCIGFTEQIERCIPLYQVVPTEPSAIEALAENTAPRYLTTYKSLKDSDNAQSREKSSEIN